MNDSTRKYLIILGDGMADEPVARLGGKTPLQAARKPAIDRLAREGRCGLLQTLDDDVPTGSEAANLAVMGYDPRKVLQGRGVLEAASMGVAVGDDDIALRCNLICLDDDGRIKNHSAGHITSEESAQIMATVDRELGGADLRFHPGVSYRNLLVARGLDPRLDCAPPHDHPGEAVEPLMIRARAPEARATAERLNELTRRSWEILRDHPVNRKRRAAGHDPANSIWLWSPGRRPTMQTFSKRFGVRGAVISAVDLIRGIGIYAGLEVIPVEGATGFWDTNYEGKADAALAALERLDFVYLHVEAPDEAGHDGNLDLKVRTIEDLDARLVARVVAGLQSRGRLDRTAIALLPDHPTPVEKRIHVRAPVPFLIRDARREPDGVERYDELSCSTGGFGTLAGDGFIRAFFGRDR
jgi:2,3-bisphosphoglycerate-independent phosphoglycerate mutase